jgi:hypothetical protein
MSCRQKMPRFPCSGQQKSLRKHLERDAMMEEQVRFLGHDEAQWLEGVENDGLGNVHLFLWPGAGF